MKRIIFIFAVAMFAGAVSAETWYFTGDEANDGSDVHAYTDPTVWKNIAGTYATAFSATDTYVLTNKGPGESSATVHGIRIHGGTFANGARLEVGYSASSGSRTDQKLYLASDCTPANPAVFARGLRFGHKAVMHTWSAAGVTNVINGEVSLAAADGGQNPIVKPVEADATLVFNGQLTGGTGLGMGLYPTDVATKRNFTVKFLDDVTWGGQLYLYDSYTQIDPGCDCNIRVTFGNITFTPSVRVNGKPNNLFNERTRMRLAVDGVNDTVILQNGLDQRDRPLHLDTYLEFPVDAATGKAGKMVLEKQLYGRTNECIGVVLVGDILGGTVTNMFELMSVPVAYPLNAEVFHLVGDSGLDGTVVKFKVVNDATHSTLFAEVPPVALYQKSDNSGQFSGKGSYIESEEGWSDGSKPHSGRHYFVIPTNSTEKVLRTPDNDLSASYTFKGDSLTIASNASLRCFLHALNVADLRMLDGSALYCSQCGQNPDNSRSIDISGNIDISGTVRIGTYNDYYMRFTNTTFTGSGTIDFGGLWIAANAKANYSLGANPGFTGKMVVRTAYRDPSSVPAYNADFGMLHLIDGRGLGADMPSPMPDALTLTDYAFLWVDRTATLAKSSNRGVTIKDCGRLWQSSNVDFRMETLLTVDGECYKDGSGMLTLAGEARAVTGGGADKFIVTNGILCVASANALKGLMLHFHRATALMVKPNLDDADFTAKGLDLSGLSTPVTLASEFAGKIPFVEPAAADMTEVPFGTTEYGILTVSASAADAVRAMLPTKPPRHFAKGKISWTERTSDGLTTFGVKQERLGAILIVE